MSDPVTTLLWICLSCAALPATVFLLNLRYYRPPARLLSTREHGRPAVSLLIPARNEERSITHCLKAAIASQDVDLEIIVLDDRSDDETAEIVDAIAKQNPCVKLFAAPPLPGDWCGKQHACWVLAGLASHERIAFIDADVRLEPTALSHMIAQAERDNVDLLSGFPREETHTLAEKLVIPLIHFVLLGFLLIGLSRRFSGAAWAAGCGQFFLTTKTAYRHAGGHASISLSRHDGVTLPRSYRRAGLRTDVVDLTALATCRMYRSVEEVWHGFAKNATEGLAAPALIIPSTLLLVFGHVLPPALLVGSLLYGWGKTAFLLALSAMILSLLPRLISVRRFDQSLVGALLHPIGVLLFVAIQWTALLQQLMGIAVTWKGRPCALETASSTVFQMECSRPHRS